MIERGAARAKARICTRAVALASHLWLLICLLGMPVRAQELPKLLTNDAYIAEVASQACPDVERPSAILAFVLGNIATDVRVYPTENYLYFRFLCRGVPYAGSLRFGPADRAAGRLEIGYYKDLAQWADEMAGDHHAYLGAADGVSVVAETDLNVRVTYQERSVLFRLNDLRGVRPGAETIGADERVIGPIQDESGVRFFLIFNGKLKIFHYILDDGAPLADELVPLAKADRIEIGRRTGFAYFRDQTRDRRILIGVFEPNSRLNTYFDGPFDQLPENFIKGEELRSAIVAADPDAKGQIDRLGAYPNDEGRYLIHPYMLYRKPADLLRINACALQKRNRADYHRCFVTEPEVGDAANLPGMPAKRK